ncbi:MAG: DUF2723 domain-containing protein [Gemmatimonadales bacterium]|nr:DUF2723 domain-containing protein [Gemmatimonadales bacterium]
MPPESSRPPYAAAGLTAAVVMGIYLATLAPTTAFWDTSEYIAAAKVLGIPHPPGNPLFTLMAHVWGLIPFAPSYAVRINLFAAATSAAAAGLWFLVIERWMRALVPVRWARWGAAFAGVLVGALSWTVWNQSTVNEKVYTVSLLSIALVMWCAVRWADEPETPRRDRWLILIAYLRALTSTNHQMGVLAAPAVGLYVLMTDWRALTRPAVLAGALSAAVVGISINYVYLPIRAGQYPPINEGEPVGFFSQALSDVLNRVQYQKPSVTERQADLLSQIGNYLQYFHWQFARDWPRAAGLATALFSLLGLGGLVALWRSDRRGAVAAGALMVTLIPLLVFYLNFKYGYSMHPDRPDLPREVRERDYFFVASFAAFGILVAAGLGGLMRLIADAVGGDERRRWLAGAPVLALALIPLLGNRVTASRAGETAAHDFAVDLLESVEPYGILITAGDNDTFPLWFAQEVEGVRRDVTLVNLSLANTDWHLRQVRRREIPDFDLAASVPLWGSDSAGGAGRAWAKPAPPVFGFTEQELDQLPEVSRVQPNAGMQFDSLTVRFGQDYLLRQDLAVLALIKQNLGVRPIYFSWSCGAYPDQTFGLTEYLVTQGLVRRLESARIAPDGEVVYNRGMGFVDLPRSRALMWDVYHWPSIARARPRGWIDPPSATILGIYEVVYGGVGGALRDAGLAVEADRADSIAARIRANIGR